VDYHVLGVNEEARFSNCIACSTTPEFWISGVLLGLSAYEWVHGINQTLFVGTCGSQAVGCEGFASSN